MLHSRCERNETNLRARILDLEQRLSDTIDRAADRERELVNQILALSNHPLAGRALSMQPAATPPSIARGTRPRALPGSRAVLSPSASGFRPGSARPPGPVDATPGGVPQRVSDPDLGVGAVDISNHDPVDESIG